MRVLLLLVLVDFCQQCASVREKYAVYFILDIYECDVNLHGNRDEEQSMDRYI
jgi:hypothetical protein